MKHVMLDLETMGMGSNAAIIAIGAVSFDIETQAIGDQFYRVVDLDSSVNAGGAIDPATVMWWMRQDDTARAQFTRPSVIIEKALFAFHCWLEDQWDLKYIQMWSNGSDFDNVILASAYRRLEMDVPWKYHNSRCYRTLRSLYPDVPWASPKTAHIAVEDARAQAEHLLAIMDYCSPRADHVD
jgi:exodeoxyribonuclease VIII